MIKRVVSKSLNRQSIIIAGVAAALLVATVVGYAALARKIELIQSHNSLHVASLRYEVDQLKFCLENSISTCSEDALRSWNNKHPSNQFEVKDFSALVEESIEYTRVD